MTDMPESCPPSDVPLPSVKGHTIITRTYVGMVIADFVYYLESGVYAVVRNYRFCCRWYNRRKDNVLPSIERKREREREESVLS